MFGFSKRPQPTIKICTGQVMAKSTQKELEKHYRFMLSSSKQELKGYIQSRVVSGKFWMAGKEKEVCDVCRENERVGIGVPLSMEPKRTLSQAPATRQLL